MKFKGRIQMKCPLFFISFHFPVGRVSINIHHMHHIPAGITIFRTGGRKRIRCDICAKFPNIVKRHNPRKPLAIASAEGTRFQQNILNEHLKSKCHEECSEADRIASVKSGERPNTAMENSIRIANRQKLTYVGELMIQVFLDAKFLNLPAFNWPARYVAGEASRAYNPVNNSTTTVGNSINLQYVNPHGHHELMTAIVRSYHDEFMKKIRESWAISLRVDGSVDSTHIDKIYVMAKVINLDGSSELLFIGIGEQTERKAEGLKNAVVEAIKTAAEEPKALLSKVSSLCTDGARVNTGSQSSLWTLLDDEVKNSGSAIPLLKIWCSAHRADLVWGDTAKKHGEINKLLFALSKISSHFNQSGLRVAELTKIAKENNISVLRIPKIFEIRWSEFSFDLIRSVLFSWEALVIYFDRNKACAVCAGFHRYLTNSENLKLIAFLGDVLFTFQQFQKKLQSDRLTIVSMVTHVNSVKRSLMELLTKPLPGAFEVGLAAKMRAGEDGDQMKSVKLRQPNNPTDFHALRKGILESIVSFLNERFHADEALLETITPFIKFESGADIEAVYEMVAPDLSLPRLSLQYRDICNNPELLGVGISLSAAISKLSATNEGRDNYREVITLLARIAACTPHSADVERCVSANNRLKTKLRSSLTVSTENEYMFIHYNMSDLDKWDPTTAANLFVSEKTRRDRDVSTSTEGRSRAQPYFKGVFSEAQKLSDPDGDEQQPDDKEKVYSNKYFDF